MFWNCISKEAQFNEGQTGWKVNQKKNESDSPQKTMPKRCLKAIILAASAELPPNQCRSII